ncbi:MAG: hypothetical protein V3U14_12965 [candidate division NC10 bacterium]
MTPNPRPLREDQHEGQDGGRHTHCNVVDPYDDEDTPDLDFLMFGDDEEKL